MICLRLSMLVWDIIWNTDVLVAITAALRGFLATILVKNMLVVNLAPSHSLQVKFQLQTYSISGDTYFQLFFTTDFVVTSTLTPRTAI